MGLLEEQQISEGAVLESLRHRRSQFVLCLSQVELLQPVFAQVISGQVFPGHQSNHLQRTTASIFRKQPLTPANSGLLPGLHRLPRPDV